MHDFLQVRVLWNGLILLAFRIEICQTVEGFAIGDIMQAYVLKILLCFGSWPLAYGYGSRCPCSKMEV